MQPWTLRARNLAIAGALVFIVAAFVMSLMTDRTLPLWFGVLPAGLLLGASATCAVVALQRGEPRKAAVGLLVGAGVLFAIFVLFMVTLVVAFRHFT